MESGKSIGDLKLLLATETGCSRFQLRLLSDERGELEDDMPVRHIKFAVGNLGLVCA